MLLWHARQPENDDDASCAHKGSSALLSRVALLYARLQQLLITRFAHLPSLVWYSLTLMVRLGNICSVHQMQERKVQYSAVAGSMSEH